MTVGVCVTRRGSWNFELGPGRFENGPLYKFGGIRGERSSYACVPPVSHFVLRRQKSQPWLCVGGSSNCCLLIPHKALQKVIPYVPSWMALLRPSWTST